MARIQIENVKKTFGKVTALDGVTLDVKDKEFFVLFGPAGAGKTTILNCIAGIAMPEEGTVKFDGEVMNLVDSANRNVAMVFENYALYPHMTVYDCIAGIAMPEEGTVKFDGEVMNLVDSANRNVAMVFENYALYPHMTVYDNIASPMRSKLYRQDEATIKEKVYNVAKMMKMEHLLERLPSQLSNGQKQRVAMGRALVRTPNVFLMDEPLAHLDAKLRNAMRTEPQCDAYRA